jgi:hypothetical protein
MAGLLIVHFDNLDKPFVMTSSEHEKLILLSTDIHVVRKGIVLKL